MEICKVVSASAPFIFLLPADLKLEFEFMAPFKEDFNFDGLTS
jgi:hypothetical protein